MIVAVGSEKNKKKEFHGRKSWIFDVCTYITLESGINIQVRLLIFEVFSRGYVLIKGATFIDF